ncbi:MAG: DUF262 domain-containing protein [Bacteroidales bacterium]|nr:DUF262 domain-containing protein [Bacteroidales bacterium]
MAQRLSIRTNNRTLTSLLQYIKQGSIQVPHFQRGFVWNRDNVKKLFDSINKGYPVGTVFLWRPEDKSEGVKESKLGAYTIPSNSNQEYFVLDGYQRLSTIFNCLINQETTELTFDSTEWNKFFNLYYDADVDEFLFLSKKPEYYQFPLRVMLVASDFRKYSREHLEKECDDEKELDRIQNNADGFCSRLLDYSITCTEIENADISQAADIFSRINKEGTKVSIDWMIHALSYDKASGFNLADTTDELLESLQQYHFEDISRNTIFRCFQSSFDDKIYFDQKKIERLARQNNFKDVIVNQSVPAIQKAVRFLYEELHMIDRRLLPYNIQLIFCMEFFKRLQNPTFEQKEWLKQWFWRTTYSSFFTNSSIADQRTEYYRFIKYLDTGNESSENGDILDLLFPSISISPFPDELNLRGVRSCALALFVINNIFDYCSDIIGNPVFRQTTIGQYYPPHAPQRTLFTDIELKSYNSIRYNVSCNKLKISFNEHLLDFSENYKKILSASFFDLNNLDNFEERAKRMENAERCFINKMGFIIDE